MCWCVEMKRKYPGHAFNIDHGVIKRLRMTSWIKVCTHNDQPCWCKKCKSITLVPNLNPTLEEMKINFPDYHFVMSAYGLVQRRVGTKWKHMCGHNRNPYHCFDCGGVGLCKDHGVEIGKCIKCTPSLLCDHSCMSILVMICMAIAVAGNQIMQIQIEMVIVAWQTTLIRKKRCSSSRS